MHANVLVSGLGFHGHTRLLQACAHLPAGSPVYLRTAAHIELGAVAPPSRAVGAAAPQHQMLAGMLRVAAQEAAELNWAHSSSSALQATGWAPNATSAADAFGVVLFFCSGR